MMMLGGIFMLGFGLIAMLLVVAIPIALIILLVWALTRHGNSQAVVPVRGLSVLSSIRTCSQCGAVLQRDWSYCSLCGSQAG
jgi:hypothetical protein